MIELKLLIEDGEIVIKRFQFVMFVINGSIFGYRYTFIHFYIEPVRKTAAVMFCTRVMRADSPDRIDSTTFLYDNMCIEYL